MYRIFQSTININILEIQPVQELVPDIRTQAVSCHPVASDAQKDQFRPFARMMQNTFFQKELPPVGDIHITGIVNIAGVLEQLTLQTTRLSTVISLADTITQGILNYTNSLICL